MKKEKAEPKKKNTNDKMARVLRGFAPEPPVVFVILSEAKYLMLCSLGLTPHLNPLPKERKKNINHPYGTQFHKIKFCV